MRIDLNRKLSVSDRKTEREKAIMSCAHKYLRLRSTAGVCLWIAMSVLILGTYLWKMEKISLGETTSQFETTYNISVLGNWLRRFNERLTEVNHLLALARFEYSTNVTRHNGYKLRKLSVKVQEWLRGQILEGQILLAKYNAEKPSLKFRSTREESILRMLLILTAGSSVSQHESMNRNIEELQAELDRISATAKVQNFTLKQLEGFIARGTYKQRLWAWRAWRDVTGPKMRPLYHELMKNYKAVAIANGYKDMGEIWRENEMGNGIGDLEEMVDQLYQDIKPLYQELYTYVRRKLHQKFPKFVDLHGFIPAHLLGNMWAQTWNIKGLTAYDNIPKIDITPTLKAKYTVSDLVKLAEDFYVSLGFEKMTESFWRDSMFIRPENREVQCHASAFDMFVPGGYRIKMCSRVNAWDLSTIYHEMGHIVYFMAYSNQPAIYRGGANTAFHEAIGDTIKMSANTPKHLRTIGLVPNTTQSNNTYQEGINRLLDMALGQVVFLPYAYLVDKYRWKIFRGDINETNYNSKWWQMREDIQGITAPLERTERDFDAGAKFHISANMPYIRYFLAHFLQFEFYEALCRKSGHTGQIHNCDFYNSKEAGHLLKSMMARGRSESWPKLLQTVTGRSTISSRPLLNYFKPLYYWLVKANRNPA